MPQESGLLHKSPHTRYFEQSKCLSREWEKETSGKDIVDFHMEILSHVMQKHEVSGIISDYSGVTDLNVAPEDVQKIAHLSTTLSWSLNNVEVAIVVNNPEILRMAELWKQLAAASRWDIGIFTSREAAESWLCDKLGITSIYA